MISFTISQAHLAELIDTIATLFNYQGTEQDKPEFVRIKIIDQIKSFYQSAKKKNYDTAFIEGAVDIT